MAEHQLSTPPTPLFATPHGSPDSVDPAKIEARTDKGVLKITAPKRSGVTSAYRKMEIKSEVHRAAGR
ncbi:MAG TPA: Hsp20/alpha crystallin family protein [Hyphomicrobium sp.]|nr:Hsp20/alpha crystallin family protein [Hyphomicrobium sp.]